MYLCTLPSPGQSSLAWTTPRSYYHAGSKTASRVRIDNRAGYRRNEFERAEFKIHLPVHPHTESCGFQWKSNLVTFFAPLHLFFSSFYQPLLTLIIPPHCPSSLCFFSGSTCLMALIYYIHFIVFFRKYRKDLPLYYLVRGKCGNEFSIGPYTSANKRYQEIINNSIDIYLYWTNKLLWLYSF